MNKGNPPRSKMSVMEQYLELKKRYPNTLLFFQLGDFFELFYEDARKAARLLDIALTRRHKSLDGEVPMAGVPAHALDGYLAKLVRRGETAVICEQVGAPEAGRGLMRREVTRVITPGTLTDEALLEARAARLLVAVHPGAGELWGVAALDLSSGRFTLGEVEQKVMLEAELERLRPAELLLAEEGAPYDAFPVPSDTHVSLLQNWHFEYGSARRLLEEQFHVHGLEGFGCAELRTAVGAAGALLYYARETQRGAVPHIQAPRLEAPEDAIHLDAASRRNLELDTGLLGEARHGLFWHIDSSVTAMGGRLLRRWLHRPLRDQGRVAARHAVVQALLEEQRYEPLRRVLREVGDSERILSRVALNSARPRDLVQLRTLLSALPELQKRAAALDCPRAHALAAALAPRPELHARLCRALVDAPPAHIREGGVFRDGYDKALDENRMLRRDAGARLAELERRERERTGLANLRLGYNQVSGYYIELSRRLRAELPAEYHCRQTLKNTVRYITPELKRFEDRVLGAGERALARERELYEALLESLHGVLTALQQCSAAAARLDALAALAERAEALDLVRPQLVPEEQLHIEGGRHLVVERNLSDAFVPNDLHMEDGRRMLVITGPNMGGKSTYMRQCALIVLLAYMGGFVPARAARLGPIDHVFTRIGAGDDLAGGRSTFMVEMTETANILYNAGPRSLVLMDEVGRGTGTIDGLALAWACAEHLVHKSGALTLFATHYFELTQLAEALPGVCNVHLEAREHDSRIVFLHDVREGPAGRSYGLQVALLAGVPPPVVESARREQERLEARLAAAYPGDTRQPELFGEAPGAAPPVDKTRLHQALLELRPDEFSPRQALEALYRLRELLAEEEASVPEAAIKAAVDRPG